MAAVSVYHMHMRVSAALSLSISLAHLPARVRFATSLACHSGAELLLPG